MDTYGNLDAFDSRLAAREDAQLAREEAKNVMQITKEKK